MHAWAQPMRADNVHNPKAVIKQCRADQSLAQGARGSDSGDPDCDSWRGIVPLTETPTRTASGGGPAGALRLRPVGIGDLAGPAGAPAAGYRAWVSAGHRRQRLTAAMARGHVAARRHFRCRRREPTGLGRVHSPPTPGPGFGQGGARPGQGLPVSVAGSRVEDRRPRHPRRSLRISRAALWPGMPVTPPPGWVPAPLR